MKFGKIRGVVVRSYGLWKSWKSVDRLPGETGSRVSVSNSGIDLAFPHGESKDSLTISQVWPAEQAGDCPHVQGSSGTPGGNPGCSSGGRTSENQGNKSPRDPQ